MPADFRHRAFRIDCKMAGDAASGNRIKANAYEIRTMNRAPILMAALLVPTFVSAQSQLTSRTIEENVTVRLPYLPCQIPNVVARIAQVLKVPAGAEGVPEQCPDSLHPPPPASGTQSLRGMTGRDALNALVQLDSRYSWVESDGVIVVRPVEAWNKRDHFLHRSASSFAFTNQNIYGALTALKGALDSRQIPTIDGPEPTPTPLAARRFSVSLGATSAYEALNAIVRAHGELAWIVGYCQSEVSYENSILTLMTFDGRGTGWRGTYARRSDGTVYGPCSEAERK